MSEAVRRHYELYPYPSYPLFASVRRSDTYASNLGALWSRFNGELPPRESQRILIAGCGSFAPYPFSVANRHTPLTALDLSRKSLKRARLHCLIHGISGVHFQEGDLCDPSVAQGPYGFIDAYGVLHHLEDPVAGLQALGARLCDGGVLRLMVYSYFTRREEESVRHAVRLLRLQEPEQVRRLMRRAPEDSRLGQFFEASSEVAYRSGLADALLHPLVRTYRIDSLLDLVAQSGLEPLLFAHGNATADFTQEVQRIRLLEAEKQSPGNFVLYLGRKPKGPCPDREAMFLVNPCLCAAISPFRIRPPQVPGRLGHQNPPLDAAARRFLRRFRQPIPASELSAQELTKASHLSDLLFLLRYRAPDTRR